MRTWIRRLILLALFGAVLGGFAYVRSEGFASSWRDFVVEQMAQRGWFMKLDALRLDPLQGGLVARGIEVYQDAGHHTLLATVDRLNVDLDLSRLMHREVVVQGVDFRNANLTFPIDPEDPKSEMLNFSHLRANVQMAGERIEIRRAEGEFFGLHLSITGSLLRPTPLSDEEERRARERHRRRIAAIKERRNIIVEAAKILKHFQTARAPRLDIVINGDLDRPEEMDATLHLSADGLRHGDYVCEELEARATYSGRMVDLTNLQVRDHLGAMQLGATYEIGGEAVDFHLHSTVDLPRLAAAILEDESLHEVVFYEPPEINADGRVLLGKAVPADAFAPLQCSGTARVGRFASRGEVLDSLGVSFGLSPEGLYFRDGVLKHKTGTLALQAMMKRGDGFRYRAQVQLDPNIIVPFLSPERMPNTREIIQRFAFRDSSAIFGEVEGSGPEPNLNRCLNRGHIELHNFRYRGEEFARVEGDVEFSGRKHRYENMRIDRAEGHGSVDEVAVDDGAGTVRLRNVVTDFDPVAVTACFARKTAEVIARYRFDKHPHVELDGLLDLNGDDTDLRVKFRGEGVGHYVLWGVDYTIAKPVGDLLFKGPKLDYDVSGAVFGSEMNCKGGVDLDPGTNDYNVDFRGGLFRYDVFTKPMPFERVRVKATCQKGLAEFDMKAALLNGNFSLRGRVDDRKQPQPFEADVRFDALNFKKFAQVYSPGFETEGDLTGHVECSGIVGDWRTLKGKGALVILNGNLYAVPILGPLTPLLGALLPKPIGGFNIAKEADATFTLANGFATTEDVVALTTAFRLVAKGQVDYLEDRIQFHAQAKFRGLPGLVLFPVSQILEYTGEGSVEDPKWRPRFFSLSSEKTPFRKSGEPAVVPAPEIPVAPVAADEPETAPKKRPSTVKAPAPKKKPSPPTLFSPPQNPPARTGK